MIHSLGLSGGIGVMRLLPSFIAGAIAVVALDYAPSAMRQITTWPSLAMAAPAPAPVGTVSNAARKGDRVVPLRPGVAINDIATVRQQSGSAVKPVPLPPRNSVRDIRAPSRSAPKREVPDGCEPSFSPVASPSLAHLTGRCVA